MHSRSVTQSAEKTVCGMRCTNGLRRHEVNAPSPGQAKEEQYQKRIHEGIRGALRNWMPGNTAARCAGASSDFPVPASEKAVVLNCVRSRQAEFIAARWCAHRALEEIGIPAGAIPVGALRGPAWPPGTVGSIAHESGVCLAIAAREAMFDGLGVDLFDIRRAVEIDEVSELFRSRDDNVFCGPLDTDLALKLTFSAKEAVVKAVSSKIGRFIDMREINVSIAAGSFRAGLNGFSERLSGRWGMVGPFLLTLAILKNDKAGIGIPLSAVRFGVPGNEARKIR